MRLLFWIIPEQYELQNYFLFNVTRNTTNASLNVGQTIVMHCYLPCFMIRIFVFIESCRPCFLIRIFVYIASFLPCFLIRPFVYIESYLPCFMIWAFHNRIQISSSCWEIVVWTCFAIPIGCIPAHIRVFHTKKNTACPRLTQISC